MSLQASKILGGIGALILFVSVFTIMFHFTVVEAVVVGFIGCIIVLISLYGLSRFYKDKGIFTNALFGVLIAIVGAIISVIIAVAIILPILLDRMQQAHQNTNGNPGEAVFYFLNNLDNATWLQIGLGVWLAYFAMCGFIIIAMFFIYRSLKKLAKHSLNRLFAITGLMLIIGAVGSIALIGLLILWVSTLMLAIAFFTLKKPKPTPSSLYTIETTSSLQTTSSTTASINSEIRAYCPYCGTPVLPENVSCPQCGKKLDE